MSDGLGDAKESEEKAVEEAFFRIVPRLVCERTAVGGERSRRRGRCAEAGPAREAALLELELELVAWGLG